MESLTAPLPPNLNWDELSSVEFTTEYGSWVAPAQHEHADGVEAGPRCGAHDLVPAVVHCTDCRSAMCAQCTVPVGSVGSFCKGCALVRAGIRRRTRRARGLRAA